MLRTLSFIAVLALAAPAFAEEQPVDPYPIKNENAGATPFEGAAMYEAFHGKAGVARIVDTFVEKSRTDPRIKEIFATTDFERFHRTLNEQFCYILGGGCAYTGRDMTLAHKDQGIQNADFNAIVENLRLAMDKEGVAFRAQNRFLAKLAPMQRQAVTR